MAKTILVADDDTVQRDLYREVFKSNGYRVLAVGDGLEALDKALKDKPDLIFTGIIMPRMDGFELVRNLRNNVATSQIPVIMFSHLGRAEDREKAQSLHVEFLVKGFDSPSHILGRVKELLTVPAKTPAAEPKPSIDLKDIEEQLRKNP